MFRIRYFIFPAALLVFANWAIHTYPHSVLATYEQRNPNLIVLERTRCFGACPAYLLQIDSSGVVSFRQGPPSNRQEVRTSTLTAGQVHDVLAGFASIHFFELNDVYPATATDGPTIYIGLAVDGKSKKITHSDTAPAGLEELERTIERAANVHRWLHGDSTKFRLQSPVAGPYLRGGEDLKNEEYVRRDVESRIKPGMTALMQVAGGRGIEAEVQAARRNRQRVTDADQARWSVTKVRQALQRGEDVNATDETGWTALMMAAVMGQPQSVSVLIDAGARVDQRDDHGDTALIGAASVRFMDLHVAAEVVRILIQHGASVDATNDLGESALMWAARAGNPESIQILLQAGANPLRTDQSGHDALYYLRNARDNLRFDPALVQRYDQAESALR